MLYNTYLISVYSYGSLGLKASKQSAVQPFFFIEAYTYKSNTHIRTQLTSSKRPLFAKLKLTRVVTSVVTPCANEVPMSRECWRYLLRAVI